MKNLRKLSKQYKHEYGDKGYFIDYTKYKMPSDYYQSKRPTIKNVANALNTFSSLSGKMNNDPISNQLSNEVEETESSDQGPIINELKAYRIKKASPRKQKAKSPFPAHFPRFIIKEKTNFYYQKFLNILDKIDEHQA